MVSAAAGMLVENPVETGDPTEFGEFREGEFLAGQVQGPAFAVQGLGFVDAGAAVRLVDLESSTVAVDQPDQTFQRRDNRAMDEVIVFHAYFVVVAFEPHRRTLEAHEILRRIECGEINRAGGETLLAQRKISVAREAARESAGDRRTDLAGRANRVNRNHQAPARGVRQNKDQNGRQRRGGRDNYRRAVKPGELTCHVR